MESGGKGERGRGVCTFGVVGEEGGEEEGREGEEVKGGGRGGCVYGLG